MSRFVNHFAFLIVIIIEIDVVDVRATLVYKYAEFLAFKVDISGYIRHFFSLRSFFSRCGRLFRGSFVRPCIVSFCLLTGNEKKRCDYYSN
ncbi:hypothetical protein SDC9_145355 [bioreactor metagenome]|uniref:Uncharacterized protein n=1 Tax=bioreactor metagenome TaxID=1076179 RepID=A0A645EBY6_9ZZZZ